MNPNSTRTAPLGIEVEFQPNDLTLVAHIPSRDGGVVYFVSEGDDRAVSEWPPFDRAILRAMLAEALRVLDATEHPANAEALR
jgi:hypothetical protein